jgi:hypothetical protein
METIPFVQSYSTPGAKRMQPDAEASFRQALQKQSKAIQDAEFVRTEWLRFCHEHRHGFLSALLGHNRLVRKLNRGGLWARLMYSKRDLLGVKNLVCCETHREALETIFENQMV